MSKEPLFCRPDIGACYCLPDTPDRCHWNADRRRWEGPCWVRRQWVYPNEDEPDA